MSNAPWRVLDEAEKAKSLELQRVHAQLRTLQMTADALAHEITEIQEAKKIV